MRGYNDFPTSYQHIINWVVNSFIIETPSICVWSYAGFGVGESCYCTFEDALKLR